MIPNFNELHPTVDALIRRVSRDLLLPEFSKGVTQEMIQHKLDNSVVTKIDFEAQAIFETELQRLLPKSCVVGEENSDNKPDAATFDKHPYSWIVDAVDGTHRFIAHEPDFTTMVSLCRGGKPIYGWIYLPTEDRMFAGGLDVGVLDNGKMLHSKSSDKPLHDFIGSLSPDAFGFFERNVIENCHQFAGLRRHLCAGYKFAGLLTGALDFAAFGRAAPWDLAAGFVLLEALGGHAATWQNKPLDLYTIWEHKREWYLATSRKDRWQEVQTAIFTGVTQPDAAFL